MMCTKSSFLVFAALLCSGLTAHADSIEQFSLNATGGNYLSPPSEPVGALSVTGTYTINTTTGMFLGGDVFVNLNGTVTELSITNYINQEKPGQNPAGIELLSGGTITFPFLQFDLAVPTSLVGYTGSDLCTVTDADCYSQGTGLIYTSGQDPDGKYEGFIQLTNGTLTPLSVSETPEPSGLILMGTGMLGIASAARKRLCSSRHSAR